MALPANVLPLGFPTGGVRSEVHPFILGNDQIQRATNIRLHLRMARTAHGWEHVPVEGEEGLLNDWRTGNTQGAFYFNPALGQSAIRFAEEAAQILHSVKGRMFRLKPNRTNGRFTFTLQDASNGLRSSENVQLAWGEGAEYYFIRTDSVGLTMIIDGRDNTTRWSSGYNVIDKDNSQLPNYAGPVRYLHAKLHIGVRMNGMNAVIVGDPVHRTNYSSAENILATTEQVYLATGQFLSPPSNMGPILSLDILPLQDTQHGHGEMIAFCPNPGGTWSADTNVWPRTDWGTKVISKHAILNTAASGPFGQCHWDGDIAFRSRKGIQSLRSARAERNTPGSPYHDLAGPMRYAMAGDFAELLRFNSMIRHETKQRIFCTVYNFSRGLHRWHRGFITACQDPEQGVPTDGSSLGAWEGLRCLPPEAGGPVQFVGGIFSEREEIFAICWNHSKQRHTVWRYRPDLEHDILEGGNKKPIQSRVVTPQFGSSMFQGTDGDFVHLLVEDAVGPLTWEVLHREPRGKWKTLGRRHETWQRGGLKNGLRSVGAFPPQPEKEQRIEFMIRWQGAASVMLRFGPKPAGTLGENTNTKGQYPCPDLYVDDDYEYNNGSDWADKIIESCTP